MSTRRHVIRWAFEEYLTGNWSLAQLRQILEDKGLVCRATAKRVSRPLSLNGLWKVLSNPYYAGLVPFQGAYYQGTHEPLVNLQTWLRVQEIMQAHNLAGEKESRHAHYLKGSIWCGGCGSRLVFSRNRGRGGVYDYFFCMGRRFKRTECKRSAVQVAWVEAGVEQFYCSFQVPAERVEEIKTAVEEVLALEQADASATIARSERRLQATKAEREKLLAAHYAGAVPLDMLKDEMDRHTREIAAAETELTIAKTNLSDLESQLARALAISGHCAEVYQEAPPAVRRQLNQGFFNKLYVAEDGQIERADLNQPFAALLIGGTVTIHNAALTSEPIPDDNMTPTEADITADGHDDATARLGQTDETPTAIRPTITETILNAQTPGQDGLTRGLNINAMAEEGRFELPLQISPY